MKLMNVSTLTKQSVAASALILSAVGGYLYHDYGPIGEAHATVTAPVASATVYRNGVTLPDFSEIVAQQGVAVVNISVTGMMKTAHSNVQGMPQLDPDDPFYEFFRRFKPPANESEAPVSAMGSGFIVTADGVVLTNAHVVADADEVTVKLTDKREFKAKVIGIDKLTDVAVLKIDAKNLPIVKIGDSKNARVGEWVVAIGAPFGFENSVTAGIVSAKSRSLPDEGYVPFLQTDVAINPGNSGGPLFDMNGEVIGINSQIYSRSGGYQGLSFAIPIDVAMKIEKELVEHGKVSRGRLGVVIQEVNQELASSFGLNKPAGALVSTVEKGSPADKAGIEPGDVILKFNDKAIDRSEDLPPLVADVTPGANAKLEVWHAGKSKIVSVNIGLMDIAGNATKQAVPSPSKLGLSVRPLSPDERKETELAQGVVVEDVDDGPAAKAGIRAGDIILSVNGEKVSDVNQLRALVAKNEKHLALLILRGDSRMFVPIQAG